MAKAKKSALLTAKNPLILQSIRIMEAFAKSNDERDFYLDRQEGFLLYADLDKNAEALAALDEELKTSAKRYLLVPKLTFYETKKLMEAFVNEKVYDIDTKEKLLDIIGSKGARDNFLEFIYDHHTELEKWQAYYQERSRIRIIEWLRQHEIVFVFEEDLDLTKNIIEKLKQHLFDSKVPKEVAAARKILDQKSKVYYSNEALNPRPKRGRPPKQQAKTEVEPQITVDIYTTVPKAGQIFLFTPDISNASQVTFSDKFETEEELRANLRGGHQSEKDARLESLNQKLAALRKLSSAQLSPSPGQSGNGGRKPWKETDDLLDDEPTIDELLEDERRMLKRAPAHVKEPIVEEVESPKSVAKEKKAAKKPAAKKKPVAKKPAAKKATTTRATRKPTKKKS